MLLSPKYSPPPITDDQPCYSTPPSSHTRTTRGSPPALPRRWLAAAVINVFTVWSNCQYLQQLGPSVIFFLRRAPPNPTPLSPSVAQVLSGRPSIKMVNRDVSRHWTPKHFSSYTVTDKRSSAIMSRHRLTRDIKGNTQHASCRLVLA